MLVKIFFSGSRPCEERKALLNECVDVQKRLLAQTAKAYKKLEQDFDEYQKFCWAYTMHHLESTIQFLETKAPELLNENQECRV
jgi:hypothetical protein